MMVNICLIFEEKNKPSVTSKLVLISFLQRKMVDKHDQ